MVFWFVWLHTQDRKCFVVEEREIDTASLFNMLRRANRLPAKEKIIHPRIVHTTYFILKLGSSPASHSRFGVVVSKKVDKRATRRNMIRRALISVVEPTIMLIHPPKDMLLIVKATANKTPPTEFAQTLRGVLEREKIL